jgi:hypothetical protein
MVRFKSIAAAIVLILLCAVAGWYGWLRLRHTSVPSQSIVASNIQRKEMAQDLGIHIEGCEAYIQPPSGEKLEPRALPGASIDGLRRLYGLESKHDNDIKEWEWQAGKFNLQAWGNSLDDEAKSIGVDVTPGHIIVTPDGIELGKDTFATLLQKMKDRGVIVKEEMGGADGTWILFASFPSVCNPQYWSEYTWYLDGTPAVEKAIGSEIPFRSNVFMREVVRNYQVEEGKQPSGEIEGQPSIHEKPTE